MPRFHNSKQKKRRVKLKDTVNATDKDAIIDGDKTNAWASYPNPNPETTEISKACTTPEEILHSKIIDRIVDPVLLADKKSQTNKMCRLIKEVDPKYADDIFRKCADLDITMESLMVLTAANF